MQRLAQDQRQPTHDVQRLEIEHVRLREDRRVEAQLPVRHREAPEIEYRQQAEDREQRVELQALRYRSALLRFLQLEGCCGFASVLFLFGHVRLMVVIKSYGDELPVAPRTPFVTQ